MLRKIRILLAFLSIVPVTLLFLDFTGTAHAWFGWMAKIQFLPAVMALNVGVIAALVILTLLLGRVYCSVICPLGIMQDVFTKLGSRDKKSQMRFSYSPAKSWLRYTVLGLFIIAMITGIGSFVALLAPYSAYGRIAQTLLSPLWGWGNNLLAYFAQRADSYAFYETEVWMRSLPVFLIAVVTLIALAVLAYKNGRTYCNTVCPVGAVLGLLSKFSLFRIRIDTDKCVKCGVCARKCKASCIDAKNHAIDYTRCVACMDCIGNCKSGAISYGLRKSVPSTQEHLEEPNKPETPPTAPTVGEQVDAGRRNFMAITGLVLGDAITKTAQLKVDGGLATIEDKKAPRRTTPIVPPGAQGLRHLAARCTGCQLCVAACPNGVLRPSTDLVTLMQPECSYEHGYCRPECTACSSVCPAGAIEKISVAEKSSIQIGHAVCVKENCISYRDGVRCGNCARHCPVGAITMVPSDPNDPNSRRIPAVDEERCIGCGACENLCPSRPHSGIYVEGHEQHKNI